MAAFEAVVSLGLAVAYLMAGPVLKVLGPQATYRLGGLSALAAALVLLPLLALRRGDGPGGASAVDGSAPAREAEPVGEVVTGSPRYTSAEALETESVEAERRTA
jgi:hypothetical protein